MTLLQFLVIHLRILIYARLYLEHRQVTLKWLNTMLHPSYRM